MTAVQHGSLGLAQHDLAFDAKAAQAFFMGDDRGYLQARTKFIEQTTELLFDLRVAQEVGASKWPHLLPYEVKWARMIAFEIGRSAGLLGANVLAVHCRKLRDLPDNGQHELTEWTQDALSALREFVAQSEPVLA
jgi:hypothetical protein